jgi:hypothetical protein
MVAPPQTALCVTADQSTVLAKDFGSLRRVLEQIQNAHLIHRFLNSSNTSFGTPATSWSVASSVRLRHSFGFLFFSQKMHAVVSGG